MLNSDAARFLYKQTLCQVDFAYSEYTKHEDIFSQEKKHIHSNVLLIFTKVERGKWTINLHFAGIWNNLVVIFIDQSRKAITQEILFSFIFSICV